MRTGLPCRRCGSPRCGRIRSKAAVQWSCAFWWSVRRRRLEDAWAALEAEAGSWHTQGGGARNPPGGVSWGSGRGGAHGRGGCGGARSPPAGSAPAGPPGRSGGGADARRAGCGWSRPPRRLRVGRRASWLGVARASDPWSRSCGLDWLAGGGAGGAGKLESAWRRSRSERWRSSCAVEMAGGGRRLFRWVRGAADAPPPAEAADHAPASWRAWMPCTPGGMLSAARSGAGARSVGLVPRRRSCHLSGRWRL